MDQTRWFNNIKKKKGSIWYWKQKWNIVTSWRFRIMIYEFCEFVLKICCPCIELFKWFTQWENHCQYLTEKIADLVDLLKFESIKLIEKRSYHKVVFLTKNTFFFMNNMTRSSPNGCSLDQLSYILFHRSIKKGAGILGPRLVQRT